jgi:hypothetical protein
MSDMPRESRVGRHGFGPPLNDEIGVDLKSGRDRLSCNWRQPFWYDLTLSPFLPSSEWLGSSVRGVTQKRLLSEAAPVLPRRHSGRVAESLREVALVIKARGECNFGH